MLLYFPCKTIPLSCFDDLAVLIYLTFHTSSLLNLESIWYYALVLLFGLFIVLAANSDHDCVRVGGMKAGELDRSVSINFLLAHLLCFY